MNLKWTHSGGVRQRVDFILQRMLSSANNGVVKVELNKHDKSSMKGMRPDTVTIFRQAHILKNEARATVKMMRRQTTIMT